MPRGAIFCAAARCCFSPLACFAARREALHVPPGAASRRSDMPPFVTAPSAAAFRQGADAVFAVREPVYVFFTCCASFAAFDSPSFLPLFSIFAPTRVYATPPLRYFATLMRFAMLFAAASDAAKRKRKRMRVRCALQARVFRVPAPCEMLAEPRCHFSPLRHAAAAFHAAFSTPTTLMLHSRAAFDSIFFCRGCRFRHAARRACHYTAAILMSRLFLRLTREMLFLPPTPPDAGAAG